MEYRIALAHVDRGIEVDAAVIAARHPSETMEHLTLRVLAWCLLHEERLEFGVGLSDPDAPDLVTRDLTGRVTTWIECGAASGEKLRKVVQHHPGVAAHAVFDSQRRREELRAELAGWRRAAEITTWLVDAALVATLAQREERRHRWTVTVVGDHFYIEADGVTVDGAIERGSAEER
jgi:uncharacterized protein YaeQ